MTGLRINPGSPTEFTSDALANAAGVIRYSGSTSWPEGTIGAAVKEQGEQIADIESPSMANIPWPGGVGYTPDSAAAQLSKLNYEVDATTAPYYCPTNGIADAIPAIQFAMNAVSARGGGIVWLPPVLYNAQAGQLVIPNNVALMGRADGPFDHSALPTTQVSAPTFLLGHASLSPFRFIGNGGKVANVAFYYPNQVAPTAATPTAYPATFLIDEGIAGSTVEKCTFINAYIGADIRSGRTTFLNNNMGCLYRDFVIDKAYDFITISDNKSEPFWDIYAGNLAFPQTLDAWVLSNKIVFETARVDSLNVTGHKIFGSYAMHLTRDSDDTGLANRSGYGSFIGCETDYIAYGVIARSARNSAKGYSYVGCGFKPNLSGSGVSGKSVVKIETGGTEPPVISLVGGSVQGSDAQWTEGKVNNLAVSAGAIVDFLGVTGLTDAASYVRTFHASWTGSKAELLAQIDADPSVLVDDGPRFSAYISDCITKSIPFAYTGQVYVNSYNPVTVAGRNVVLRQFGDGCIVGGPDLGNRLLKIINTSGGLARLADCHTDGLKFNVEKCAPGALGSVNCLELTGFRNVLVENCDMYHGQFYQTAGGDSGLFLACQNATLRNNRVQGAVDLGFYISGSFNGLTDNSNLIIEGNTFINCANAWSAKRNYKYVSAVGNHYTGCRNGAAMTSTPSDGTGLGTISGSTVIMAAETHKDCGAACIDLRGTQNVQVDCVVDGTFGQDKDAVQQSNASVIKLDDADGCNIRFTYSGTSTDSSHSAVRIQNGSIDNFVSGVVRGTIANGLLETNGDNNTIELKLGTGVTAPGTIVGTKTQFIYDQDGTRGYLIGTLDRLPGRRPFGGAVNTVSISLGASSVDRIIKMQPPSSPNINAILPSGLPSGSIIGVIKWPGGGSGRVLVRNPANTSSLARLRVDNDIVWMVCDGANGWSVAQGNLAEWSIDKGDYTLPTGAKRQTFNRFSGASATLALTSGTLQVAALALIAGDSIASATFVCATQASSLTGRWFALYDQARNLLAVTADDTTAWVAGAALTLNFATPYTVENSGLYYVAICEVATTPTVLRGTGVSSNVAGLAPIMTGTSSTGLTNAASAPATAATIAVGSANPYAYLG